ncbi:MAG: ribosome maturation factor RimM [Actinomycetia bacterium]|nr:ribosome maturation factor RimM [Actinomycetes bacterium]
MSVELLEVGVVRKAFGIRGEVLVDLHAAREERTAAGVVFSTPGGELTVVAAKPHQGKWIFSFEGFFDRNRAETLRGTVLRAEPLDDPDVLWVHELVGSRVIETDGTDRGRVESLRANPASDLLELDSGALVPLTFVTERRHDDGERIVVVEVPPGLFDL